MLLGSELLQAEDVAFIEAIADAGIESAEDTVEESRGDARVATEIDDDAESDRGVAVSSKIVWVKPHEVAAAKVVIKAAERTGRPVSPAVRKIAAAKPARRKLAD